MYSMNPYVCVQVYLATGLFVVVSFVLNISVFYAPLSMGTGVYNLLNEPLCLCTGAQYVLHEPLCLCTGVPDDWPLCRRLLDLIHCAT
jgi:hypothetical protein